MDHGIFMQTNLSVLNKKQKLDFIYTAIVEEIMIRFKGDRKILANVLTEKGPFALGDDEALINEIFSLVIKQAVDPLTSRDAAIVQLKEFLEGKIKLQQSYFNYSGESSLPEIEIKQAIIVSPSFKKWLVLCIIAVALHKEFSKIPNVEVFKSIDIDNKPIISKHKVKRFLGAVWLKMPLIALVIALAISASVSNLPLTYSGVFVGLPIDMIDASFVNRGIAHNKSLFVLINILIFAVITYLFSELKLWQFIFEKTGDYKTLRTLGFMFEATLCILIFAGIFMKSNFQSQSDIDLAVQNKNYSEAVSLVNSHPNLVQIKKDYILAQIYAAKFEETKSNEALEETKKLASITLKENHQNWMTDDAIKRIDQTNLRPYDKNASDPVFFKIWWMVVMGFLLLGRISIFTQIKRVKKT